MKGKLVRCLTTIATVAMLTTSMGINCEAATQPKLNKTKITLTAGKSYTLKVKGTSSRIIWKTSKKTVATVSSKGRVVAKKKGTTVVSARFSYKKSGKKITKTLKCKVVVNAKKVTPTPKPTKTSKPTATPRPTSTPKPTATSTVAPTTTPTPEVVQATVTPTEAPVEVVTAETPVITVTPTEAPVEIVPTEIPVHVHDYNARYEVIKESTCTEEGLMNMYCECGEYIQKVIKPYHHNIGVVQGKEYHCYPTETTGGYMNVECNDCGAHFTHDFPALTDENYPLEGWVYEKHDYKYSPEIAAIRGFNTVDRRHDDPYILVTDYIGSEENPTLKGSYVIDGVEYQVITRTLKCSSPTVQTIRFYGVREENPDDSAIVEKRIQFSALNGDLYLADFDWSL